MKYNVTCDLCIQRKKKCNRQHPCSYCISRNATCHYTLGKLELSDIKQWEERIRKLEVLLIVPYKYPWEKRIPAEHDEIVLSEKLQNLLFISDHDYLMELYFRKFNWNYFYLTEDYLREAASEFPPLKNVLCSNGAIFVDRTPIGVSNRVELAIIYLEKAASFPFVTERSPISVLTLAHISMASFRLQKGNHLLYLNYAVTMAKFLGMNTEK
ncbi:hypothetical protein HDV06_002633, partial [Boothiomyces sp. JEL0866]